MKKLPSVQTVFAEAWSTVVASMLPLFKLYIITTILGLLIAAVFGTLAFIGGFGGSLGLLGGKISTEAFLQSVNFPVLITSGVVGGISSFVLMMAMTISMIKILDKKGNLAPTSALRNSVSQIVPLVFASIIATFFVLGSSVLFVIPGIFVGLLLMFVQAEIVLSNAGPLQAIKRSVNMVMANFGQLLVHWGALILGYIAVVIVIPRVLGTIVPDLRGLLSLVGIVVNVVAGWTLTSYNVALYKKLPKETKAKSIMWMWLLATLGWVMFLFVSSGILKLISSPAFKDAFMDGMGNKQRPGIQNEMMMKKYQQQYKQQLKEYESPQNGNTYTQ